MNVCNILPCQKVSLFIIYLCTAPGTISLSPYQQLTDVTLEASGHWPVTMDIRTASDLNERMEPSDVPLRAKGFLIEGKLITGLRVELVRVSDLATIEIFIIFPLQGMGYIDIFINHYLFYRLLRILILKCDQINWRKEVKIQKTIYRLRETLIIIKSVAYTAPKGTLRVNQTSATDWQMEVRRNNVIILVLRSVKSNNVDFLNQILYFSIKLLIVYTIFLNLFYVRY